MTATEIGQMIGVLLIVVLGILAGYKNGYYLKKIMGDKNIEEPK